MTVSTATATVRSRPPRALEEVRGLLLSAIADEGSIDPEQLQVTAVFNSDKHVLGVRLRTDTDDEVQAVLDRVEARLEAAGIVALNPRWRLLARPTP